MKKLRALLPKLLIYDYNLFIVLLCPIAMDLQAWQKGKNKEKATKKTGKEKVMKKFLYFFLTALCLLLLTPIAFASETIALDDGILCGAPPGISAQQDREGLYAATPGIAATALTETAFLPQTNACVATMNAFATAKKGAIADSNNSAIDTRSGVMPLAAGKILAVGNESFFYTNAPTTGKGLVILKKPAVASLSLTSQNTPA